MTAKRLTILSPDGHALASLDAAMRSAGLDPSDRACITVVTWRPGASASGVETVSVFRPIRSGWLRRIVDALDRIYSRSIVIRNAFRFTPWDMSSRFRRACRQDPVAVAAIRDASVLIVAEREAVLAGWTAARRRVPPQRTVLGLIAGLAQFAEMRSPRVED